MPDLCIMLLTYNRMEYANVALRSTLRKLHYTRGNVLVHIASDGDEQSYTERLINAALAEGAYDITLSNSERGGYGKNFNLATQVIHSLPGVKYVLPLEDDWEAIAEIDADGYTLAMDEGGYGCLRMGYIGYTQPMKGLIRWNNDMHFLGLDPGSPEPHVFTGHPRIETVEWQRSVGAWPEGLPAGATEFAVAHLEEARHGVVWPMDVDPRSGYGLFAHIGSIQAEDAVQA